MLSCVRYDIVVDRYGAHFDSLCVHELFALCVLFVDQAQEIYLSYSTDVYDQASKELPEQDVRYISCTEEGCKAAEFRFKGIITGRGKLKSEMKVTITASGPGWSAPYLDEAPVYGERTPSYEDTIFSRSVLHIRLSCM
jgi:hypothetical protein